MSDLYKVGWISDGHEELPFHHANIWARETTTGPDRLVIAPNSNHVSFLLKLAACLPEPYLLLYVLVIPRGGGKPRRYQSNYAFTYTQLQEFLTTYSDYFEQDGRHNLWIVSKSGGQLIYDRHNVIYTYGPLEAFIAELVSSGLTESKQLRFPSPHIHRYHTEFDASEQRILASESWSISPLRHGDENPE